MIQTDFDVDQNLRKFTVFRLLYTFFSMQRLPQEMTPGIPILLEQDIYKRTFVPNFIKI